MKKTTLIPIIFVVASALLALSAQTQRGSGDLPHLSKQGTATQLIVDGKPFVMLAGELHNSSASNLDYMKPIWPRLTALNVNTVLATISWELVEPVEGKYDFALVDGLIHEARRNNMRLVFLWFGSWKNGNSSYTPGWIKTNVEKYPRMRRKDGVNTEILSPFAEINRMADQRAFVAAMRRIREVDSGYNTVVMMQVQNEVGLMADARDRSPLAEAAWAKAVPAELMSYLQKHKANLLPEVSKVWETTGFRNSGSWAEVFGESPDAEEFFMAWHMGRYIGLMAKAGKAEYNIPMYANAWLVQKETQKPGGYPSGGPVSKVMDIWRAAAPDIDLLAPDIYLSDFKGVCASYTRSGNPLFIPEASRGPIAAANAFWAIAQHDALGFAPFGIDSVPADSPLKDSYDVLSQLMPVMTKHHGQGKMVGLLETNQENEVVDLGGYELRVDYRWGRNRNKDEQFKGHGLDHHTGPWRIHHGRKRVQLQFSCKARGRRRANLLSR
jgi:beta-galactosidase GanA/predicted small secreted protein